MSRRRAALLGRTLAAAQLAGGAALLARPGDGAAIAAGPDGRRPPALIVRVLGVRLAAQGAAALLRPTRAVVLGGAAVDALHAASMFALAATGTAYRRAALVSAVTACAGAAWACATTLGRTVR